MSQTDIKEKLLNSIDENRENILNLSRFLYENPEVGLKEFKASAKIIEMMKEKGFVIREDFEEMPTAFVASRKNGEGPKIAFIAEYDALPGIGHACGHNLIASISYGAAVGLAEVLEHFNGEVLLVGTPSEETGDGKPFLIEKGVFDDVDVAMMIHPGNKTKIKPNVQAISGMDFHFYGKAAHSGQSPHLGVNALDAVVLLFNNINALRQQILPHERIHGIILEAGKAVNVTPDYGYVRLEVRSEEEKSFQKLKDSVVKCAEAAALATGTRLEWEHFEPDCKAMKSNDALSKIFEKNMNEFGIFESENIQNESDGATDMGNLSQVLPSIHVYLKMVEGDYANHSPEFLESIKSEFTETKLIEASKILALTGLEILEDDGKLKKIKEEFDREK